MLVVQMHADLKTH